MSTAATLLDHGVAVAIGLLVGLEREWRQRDRPSVLAGSRTFAVIALAGAVAADVDVTVVAAGLLAVAVLLAVGYVRAGDPDIGLTTETAALATFLLGALAVSTPEVAVPLAIVLTALLVARERLHRFARSLLSEREVDDTVKVLVVAFVVLPLLPEGARGPYGVLDARRIWTIVVLVTVVGWLGYVATRLLGARHGLAVEGLAGGFVSGAATTAALARAARETAVTPAHLAGALLASVATLVQLCVVVGVADDEVLRRLLPAVAATGALLLAEAAVLSRRASGDAAALSPVRPFRLVPALVLAAVLTAVLLVSRWAGDVIGGEASVATAAVAGLADTHGAAGASAGLVRQGALGIGSGIAAIGAALAANTVTKVVLAFTAGGARFGTRFTALLLPPAAVMAALTVLATR